jgi:hypothetical protein
MIEAKLQDVVVDVATWQSDDLYASYPEGARSKDAYFPPANCPHAFIRQGRRYLYKRSNKKYPDQLWGEVVSYQVGCLLGVTVPPAFVATNSAENDCAALIEWFYEDGKAIFTPGGSYMQALIPEFDRKRGELHNFHAVQTLARAFSMLRISDDSWQEKWAELFLFDALIGNTDRHQDNWGYLGVKRNNMAHVTLAPLFDNGTSLGHERFPEHVATWTDANYLRYVEKGTHHIRWQKGDGGGVRHIELLVKLIHMHPQLRMFMLDKIAQFDMAELERILDYLCTLPLAIALTRARKTMYIKLLGIRKQKIMAALG